MDQAASPASSSFSSELPKAFPDERRCKTPIGTEQARRLFPPAQSRHTDHLGHIFSGSALKTSDNGDSSPSAVLQPLAPNQPPRRVTQNLSPSDLPVAFCLSIVETGNRTCPPSSISLSSDTPSFYLPEGVIVRLSFSRGYNLNSFNLSSLVTIPSCHKVLMNWLPVPSLQGTQGCPETVGAQLGCGPPSVSWELASHCDFVLRRGFGDSQNLPMLPVPGWLRPHLSFLWQLPSLRPFCSEAKFIPPG